MALAGGERTAPLTTYRRVHDVLTAERGRAVGRPCYGCGAPATGWMRIRPATHIGTDSHGKVVRWTADLDAYEPGCSRCNARMDRGGSLTLCPRGHARAAWGADRHGNCHGCIRDKNARRRAAQRREAS